MRVTMQDCGQFLMNEVKGYRATYCSQIVGGLEHERVAGYLNKWSSIKKKSYMGTSTRRYPLFWRKAICSWMILFMRSVLVK